MDALRSILLETAQYSRRPTAPSLAARYDVAAFRAFSGEYRARLASRMNTSPQTVTSIRQCLSPEWAGPLAAALIAEGVDEARVREAAAIDFGEALGVSVSTARKIAAEAVRSPMWMPVLCWALRAQNAQTPVTRERMLLWCIHASR